MHLQNIQSSRGSTSKAKIYGQKASIGYDESNSDDAELDPSQAVTERLSSIGHAGNTASGLGAMNVLSSAARIVRSSSYGVKQSRSLSPSPDDIAMDVSPRRAAEKASPSYSGFNYGFSRTSARQEESSNWQTNTLIKDTSLKFENPAYRYSNGIDLQGPRALINAYGIDERQKPLSYKHLRVDYPNVNGTHKSASLKRWQNTEEEEFNWEDMSPTLGERNKSNDLFSSAIAPPASFGTRAGFGTHPDVPLVTSDFRSNRSKQAQLPVFNGSSLAEDVSAISVWYFMPYPFFIIFRDLWDIIYCFDLKIVKMECW